MDIRTEEDADNAQELVDRLKQQIGELKAQMKKNNFSNKKVMGLIEEQMQFLISLQEDLLLYRTTESGVLPHCVDLTVVRGYLRSLFMSDGHTLALESDAIAVRDLLYGEDFSILKAQQVAEMLGYELRVNAVKMSK